MSYGPGERDMDLVRDLLLRMEAGEYRFATLGTPEDNKTGYHLGLMENGGLIQIKSKLIDGSTFIDRITWKGHDFLDSVRDAEIWARTKEGARKIGGGGIDLLMALAKGLLKKKIEELTGIELNL